MTTPKQSVIAAQGKVPTDMGAFDKVDCPQWPGDQSCVVVDEGLMRTRFAFAGDAVIKQGEMKLLCRVWTELNAICARDGAPVGVSEEYFESLKGQLGALIKRATGTGPHCHPLLYAKLAEEETDAK